MPLDPQAKEMLELTANANLPPTNTLSPAQARYNSRLRKPMEGPHEIKAMDILVRGKDGLLTARTYTPQGVGPFPVLIWFHGGGWVVGDLDGTDGTARELAAYANCLVVSIDYRLAPETKFPGPVEDCYEATAWIADNADKINGDSERIAVGGASAGGNLAAAVSLMARDRGEPFIIFQLLVYPVTDRNVATESYQNNAEGYGLTRDTMDWYWNHYLRDDGDATNPYAAPLQAKDLSLLPAAMVIAAEFDPLCTEAELYANAMEAAGVPTEYICYDGMIHGFFGMTPTIDKAKLAMEDACSSLREVFDNKS